MGPVKNITKAIVQVPYSWELFYSAGAVRDRWCGLRNLAEHMKRVPVFAEYATLAKTRNCIGFLAKNDILPAANPGQIS